MITVKTILKLEQAFILSLSCLRMKIMSLISRTYAYKTKVILYIPGVPFQKAENPSSLSIVWAQCIKPLYVVWPFLDATCNLVLITSAGVGIAAAGIPEL